MNICLRFQKHPKFEIGGAERQMLLIAEYINRPNINFHYIIKDTSKLEHDIERLNEVTIEIYGTNLRVFKPKFLNRMFEILNNLDIFLLLKFYNKFNFDIYHLRGANVITGIWAFFSKLIKKKHFIFTIAGARDCIPGIYPWHPIFYFLYKYALKRADMVIVIADYLKKLLYDNYGIKSLVIKSGHPVPDGPFHKEDPPLILWISRLKKVKRPELFLSLVKKLKDLNVNFLLIGPGNYLKEKIIQLAEQQGNFDYIPGVPRGKDNQYYRKASILVNTSSYEGYPNAFIQSWMRETPVMSLDVDPDEVIKKHNLGLYFGGRLADMAEAITKLIKKKSKLESMGKGCRAFAIKHHNIEKTAQKHLKIYKLLNKYK